jgi:hypothetical protein
MSVLAAPPGLELIPNVSPLVSKRSWADVVKSQRCETKRERTSPKRKEQSFQSDTDEETQANSSTVDSDISDSESSIGDSLLLRPEAVTCLLDVNDPIQSKQQSDLETCRPESACVNASKCTRLRKSAPVFVPIGTDSAIATIPPPPGLRTSLRIQANAFVPKGW